MTETFILILALILLTLGSAFCSGSETALFSLSPMKIKAYRYDPNPRKRLISELLRQPKDLLVTVFMLNTVVNILLQNVASRMFGAQAGWDLKVGVPLLLTLFLGEIIPKNIGMQNNASISYHVVTTIDFFHRWLGVVRRVTVAVTNPISRLMFFYFKKETSVSEEELMHVLETSQKHGVLHREEANLVKGYLELHSSTVKEIRVPKEDVLFYEISEPLSKLIHLFVEQECTRIPVCKGSLENILGIITAKQFFLHGHKIKKGDEINRLLLKPFFIPENTPVNFLLKQFDETNQVLALVVDEYGSFAGLVTREDIAEQIIGDITDRRDQMPLYTISGKNEIIASGKLELAEFNRHFHVDLKSIGNMVTIGGWLIERVEEIPKGGATFELDNFLFKVLAADLKRVTRLYIRKLQGKFNKR